MTLSNMTALFGAMLILAFYPGVSSLAVAARSAAFGFKQGIVTTLGILSGDLLFIFIAISGLSYITESIGILFILIKYLGGAYLIWLGLGHWRKTAFITNPEKLNETSMLSSFMNGFLITLADVKAIFFYLVFFPAYIDLTSLTFIQTGILVLISISAVTVAKVSYALMTHRARTVLNKPGTLKGINIVVGCIMVGTGIYLILKT
ncbi:MAG: LysE family translocator [Gammaproteobacteria bacterium]|nr:LysE family translocator [Gammaproteobacteria bacterium]MBT3724029.1 LysE family translocator [Gammaproteobacteria bacterium]MBT4194379.1 LysE family translocator [Gammaproteobacteria bacterium]MBT4451194.1 LysE family translocator [Gammaproteobacteria bacterium]MBT4859299.1 LysE family translocator [Gammaproteobacteria bacterium]